MKKIILIVISSILYSTPIPKIHHYHQPKIISTSKLINRTVPIKQLAPKLAIKYTKPIHFNKQGYPNFSKYSKLNIKSANLTGHYKTDVKKIEKIAKKQNPKWKKKIGYKWHYHEDGKTMQYIPNDLHSAIEHKSITKSIISKANFKQIVKEAPNKIGVYMVRLNGEVKYVGRAIEQRENQGTKGLRKRLQEHYRGSNSGKKELYEYRDKVHVTYETYETVNEVKKAEAELIKKYDTVKNGWNKRYEQINNKGEK